MAIVSLFSSIFSWLTVNLASGDNVINERLYIGGMRIVD